MQTVPQNGRDAHLPVMRVGVTEGTADEQNKRPTAPTPGARRTGEAPSSPA